jgi:2-polyprenyl-3-methyl-5-hydroxy-6-metoxy-1,4-benzoquinol methylase
MEEVKEFYNKYSYPSSKQFTKKQEKINRKLINKILEIGNLNLNNIKNKKILVAGCGTGEKAVYLSKHGANVTAIDFSSTQLNEAKNRSFINNIPQNKISFYKKDIIKDNLLDLGYFDIILCIGVLHHTENAYLGFKKLSELLKYKGIIILGLYHRYSRIRYRTYRFFLRNLISKNPDKLINWIRTQKFSKKLKAAPISTLYDRYGVPYESYYTLREIKKWFLKNNIKFIKNSSNVNGLEFTKIFEPKTIFFISGFKKK